MFDTHKLNDLGFDQMKNYKSVMAVATKAVLDFMPESREKSIFITKMEEAIFFGAKAISQKPENHTEIIGY
jgi:hypothetical protein